MNKNLEQLYESKWELLLTETGKLSSKASSPLLIKVDKNYIESEKKIMIVGQETDGWFGELNKGESSVETLMNGYSDYINGRTKNGRERYKRAFWNRKNYRFFEEHLTGYFAGTSVAFVWNNISKIGKYGGGKPTDSICQLERDYFNIFAKEFEILRPNIVIFTTGRTLDAFIRHHFGEGVEFVPKLSLSDGSLADRTLNLLAEVRIPQHPKVKSVRIEHPNRRTLDNLVTLKVLKRLIESET